MLPDPRYSWQAGIVEAVAKMTNRQLLERVIDLAAENPDDDRVAWEFSYCEEGLKERLSGWLKEDLPERKIAHVDRPIEAPLWDPDDTHPQIVNVPQSGKRSDRDSYTERCDMCMSTLTQDRDECFDCGHPVTWVGSKSADLRAKRNNAKRVDFIAKSRGELADRLSDTTAFVLAVARATSIGLKCDYAKGEEEAVRNYEIAYGEDAVRSAANRFKGEGTKGRGLIVRVLAYFERYNPVIQGGNKPNSLTELL